MPVADHPVHRSGIRDAEHRYGCWNRAPFKEMVEHSQGGTSWPFAMSRNCMYDRSLDDSACAGCTHAGERGLHA